MYRASFWVGGHSDASAVVTEVVITLETIVRRRVLTFKPIVTVTSLAVIGLDLQVPSVFVPLTWQTASVLQRVFDGAHLRRLHDLLDRALGALLQRELAAVGVAHVDDADHRQREDRGDQGHLDDRRAAIVRGQPVV